MMRKVLPLAGAIAVIGANSLALSPIASAVARSFPGVDAPGVMNAAVVYGLATAAGALVLAPATDRVGHRQALVGSLLVLAAALTVSAIAPNLLIFCVAQGLAGLAAGCALPAIYTLSALVAEKGRESETLGWVLTGWTVSLVIGVSLSAVVAEIAHWRLVFAGLAVAAGSLAVTVGRSRHLMVSIPSTRASSPLTALRARGIVPALLTVAVYMTAFYGLYAYLGPHLTEVLLLSTATAGLAPAAYGLGFGVAAFADRLLDRYGSSAATPVAFLALGTVYVALAAAAGHAALLISLCFVWGMANHIGLNLIVGRLTTLDAEQRGAILGLYSAVTYLAVSAGALFYRPLFEQFGIAGCALASACCIAPALALSLQRRTGPSRKPLETEIDPIKPSATTEVAS